VGDTSLLRLPTGTDVLFTTRIKLVQARDYAVTIAYVTNVTDAEEEPLRTIALV
jgi:hypothetical protein